jgi:CRP-like cAMP-binding protein
VIPIVSRMKDGRTVEVGLVGNDGIVGIRALVEASAIPYHHLTLTGCNAYRMPAEVLTAEFKRSGALQDALLRYTQARLLQASPRRWVTSSKRTCSPTAMGASRSAPGDAWSARPASATASSLRGSSTCCRDTLPRRACSPRVRPPPTDLPPHALWLLLTHCFSIGRCFRGHLRGHVSSVATAGSARPCRAVREGSSISPLRMSGIRHSDKSDTVAQSSLVKDVDKKDRSTPCRRRKRSRRRSTS